MIKSLENYYELNAESLVFDLDKDEKSKLLIELLRDASNKENCAVKLHNYLIDSFTSGPDLKDLGYMLIDTFKTLECKWEKENGK